MINFPNKLYSYNESIISKFVVIINELNSCNATVCELYDKLNNHFPNINDYIDALSCLYALNKIELENNILKISEYAKRDNL